MMTKMIITGGDQTMYDALNSSAMRNAPVYALGRQWAVVHCEYNTRLTPGYFKLKELVPVVPARVFDEKQQAWQIANAWLDQRMNPLVQMVPGDPDCDACVLARQFMRAIKSRETGVFSCP